MKQTITFLLLFTSCLAFARANAEVPAEMSSPAATPATLALQPAIVRAARHLRAGTILGKADLISSGSDNSAEVAESIIGMETKRTIYANRAITASEIGYPTAIKRNAIVTIEFKKGPLLITTEARALDAGAVGETVRVMNISSKTILSAVVVSSNKVQAR